jgi:integrase
MFGEHPQAARLLKSRRQGYGSALAFHLANALFQTACRFEELIQLTWSDCQRVGEELHSHAQL